MDFKINYGKCELPLDVAGVEAKYNAKYVGDFCLKTANGGWSDAPGAVFYQETPPVEGYSHYFAIIDRMGSFYITSGESAFSEPITAIVGSDGEVVYSRYRHDYRSLSDGSGAIDGGRDYTKVAGDFKRFRQAILKVVGHELVLVDFKEKSPELT